MAAKSRTAKTRTTSSQADIPVVGPREPCPCGSGKRYKACHGKRARATVAAVPARPFAGLPHECDWVAMREIIPAATAALTLREQPGDRKVTLTTVLPLAVAGLTNEDGDVFVAMQTAAASSDPSRDIAKALETALAAEPGEMVPPDPNPGTGNRLQDLIDTDAPFEVTVHDDFEFWPEVAGPLATEMAASKERAAAQAPPTVRLSSVEAAYWCRIADREQIRWVLPHDEEPLLDALARLHAADADGLGEGTRLLGTFRAYGLLVPVWDLPAGTIADDMEVPVEAFAQRLEEALAVSTALTPEERRARSGLANRQITLR